MEVLCLAGSATTEIVRKECETIGFKLKSCSKTEEACQLIKEKTWIAVVAALGENKKRPVLVFTEQFYPSDLPVLFIVRIFYR